MNCECTSSELYCSLCAVNKPLVSALLWVGLLIRSLMVNGYIQIILRRTVIKAHVHLQYKGRAVQKLVSKQTVGRKRPNSLLSSLTRSEKMALRYNVYLTVSGSAISGYLRSSTTLNSSNCKHLPTGWVPTVAPPGFCNRGEVRYGSIGGLEYEVPQSRLNCLCINVYLCSTALQCICRVIRRSSMTIKAHILHNFWTSTHRGKLPPLPPWRRHWVPIQRLAFERESFQREALQR